MDHNRLDRRNRAWYARQGSIAGMARDEGFADEGEHAAYDRIAEEVRRRPILDLGVGAGRTVALLRALSTDYLGMDYLPPMLAAAHARHPDVAFRVGDARDLSALPADHFALVVFSCQGLDSVDHSGRRQVLEQVWRVLAPGGVFWFSTLNRDGPAARYRPWRPVASSPSSRRLGLGALATRARAWLRVPFYLRRYRRGLALAQAGDDWAVAPFFAGGWHLVAHFTTLAGLLREVAAAGFLPDPEVFEDARGRHVGTADDLRPVVAFNVLARKPG